MKLFGIEIKRAPDTLQSVNGSGRGWSSWPWTIREANTGDWQKNIEWTRETVLAHFAVYACINLISNDIANLPWGIMRRNEDGTWEETYVNSKSPVLRRPNRYQNDIQFRQWWAMSKLLHGNTYVLLGRDNRGEVTEEYVLDPCGAQVLVSPDGSVFYQFKTDNLTGIEENEVAIPASEIMHDRMNCLFHPLVGISPLYACGASAAAGLKMQNDSAIFFANGANPGGVLSAPGPISDETAKRLSQNWTANYTGANAGKVAVMGDGLRFEAMRMNYRDAQLIEQLKFNAEMVCTAFGVPPFKIGMGSIPAGMKVSDMQLMYFQNALHSPIENMERCQDDGLNLNGRESRTELGTETLLRMDPASLVTSQVELVGGGISTPNEARLKFNKKPLTGGNTVYMQMQDLPLSEASKNTVASTVVAPAPTATATPPAEDDTEEQMKQFMAEITKGLTHV